MRARLSIAAALCAVGVACGGSVPPDGLTIFAASSLAGPLQELATLHEMRSGHPVRLHLGATGTLATQLRHGAPADVFISADPTITTALIDDGWLDARSRVAIAGNTLVVVEPAARVPATLSVADLLADPVRRIGVGDPDTVPMGRYAQRWLRAEGAWDRLMAARRLVPGASARAVVVQVQSGATDAAVVFATDGAIHRDLRVIHHVPEAATGPIRYDGAVASGGPHRILAQVFLDVLAGPEGQHVLRDAGFVPMQRLLP